MKPAEMVKLSRDWIEDHIGATNHDVPDDLLHAWTVENDSSDAVSAGSLMAVFVFGLLIHTLKARNWPTEGKVALQFPDLRHAFTTWMLKLYLTRFHRETNLKIDPMPLFTFFVEETLRFSRHRTVEQGHGQSGETDNVVSEEKKPSPVRNPDSCSCGESFDPSSSRSSIAGQQPVANAER